jgi:four helix bundle protein
MTPDDLRERTTAFAIAVLQFTAECRRRPELRQIADQLTDSSSSTAGNYRSACRARSHREFISKIAIALEEVDESVGWLEILSRSGLIDSKDLAPLLLEARELMSILGASRKTAERRAWERGRKPGRQR